MEMELSQVDTARRLVVRFTDCIISLNNWNISSVSRRHVPGRSRVTTSERNCFFLFLIGGREILLRCESAFTVQVSMQDDRLCVSA
ncbi:hypothetical protein TNCV_635731 [Trichonephila clavipes]|nr:hypothetical protein TNCV_635731 [Trichonephila clavipes]